MRLCGIHVRMHERAGAKLRKVAMPDGTELPPHLRPDENPTSGREGR